MVASGLPNRNGEKHVAEIARLSLDLLRTMQEQQMPHLPDQKICLRLGFNTGSLELYILCSYNFVITFIEMVIILFKTT